MKKSQFTYSKGSYKDKIEKQGQRMNYDRELMKSNREYVKRKSQIPQNMGKPVTASINTDEGVRTHSSKSKPAWIGNKIVNKHWEAYDGRKVDSKKEKIHLKNVPKHFPVVQPAIPVPRTSFIHFTLFIHVLRCGKTKD